MTLDSVDKSVRVPFGARAGQRVTTIVLLVIVVLFMLAALFAPFFPVGSPTVAADLGLDRTKMVFIQLAAAVQWIMLAVTVGITTWFLGKKWPAFYIPLVTGVISTVSYWLTYASVVYVL